jgi:hypothetical protein
MIKKHFSYLKLLLIFLTAIIGCGPSVSDQFPAFDSEMKLFKESTEYTKFLNYLKESERIATEGLYEKYKGTLELEMFFQDFTDSSQKCQSKFAQVSSEVKNRKILKFVDDQYFFFSIPGQFWMDLEDYRLKDAPPPDIKKFLVEMESKQKELDGKFRELKFDT